MTKTAAAITALFLMTTQFSLANEPHFFRLEVIDQTTEEPTEVKMNLPLSMIGAMGPQIQGALDEGINNVEMDGEHFDLRQVWHEIQAVGPHEYARINDPDTSVVVSTTETHIVIEVDEMDKQMTISVPLSVGDIILGSDSIDFQEVVDQLVDLEEEYLITITGNQFNMKAWID